MTNGAQSHECYRKLEEIFIFQARDFKFGDSLGVGKLATNAELQLNVSNIIPASPKMTRIWYVNTNLKILTKLTTKN